MDKPLKKPACPFSAVIYFGEAVQEGVQGCSVTCHISTLLFVILEQ